MNRWEHVNCCKTVGCSLFGIANSPYYKHVGQNCHCPECGCVFPVISVAALHSCSQQSNQHYPNILLYCPDCGRHETLVRHGKGKNGLQRWRCRVCNLSFTHYARSVGYDRDLESLRNAIAAGTSFRDLQEKKQLGRELSRLAFLSRVEQSHSQITSFEAVYSTATFTVGFNESENQLYVIVTADNRTGCIIAVSTNYVPLKTGISPEWWYPSMPAEHCTSQKIINQIFDKDRIISQRPLFFDVSYGPARIKRNDPGVIVKPVLAAYRHFALVYALTNYRLLSVHHWLEHECFLYGACLMANRNDVKEQRSHISFIREYGTRDETKRLRSERVSSDIIWHNRWHYYSQKGYELALCHLTGGSGHSSFRYSTLKPALAFQEYIFRHPVWPQLIRLSPRNIVHLLEHLATEYNQESNP